MQYRQMRHSDLPQAAALWQQTFGDTQEYVVASIKSFAGLENAFVAEDDGRLCAQLFAVPCFRNSWQGIYLYALATQPELRGKGIMGALMQHAEAVGRERGASFACLIPADLPLYAFYRKRGYVQDAPLYLAQGACVDVGTIPLPIPVDTQEFTTLRHSMIPQAVIFNEWRGGFILDDLAADCWQATRAGDGYAIWQVQGQVLRVAEAAARDAQGVRLLIQALCSYKNCAYWQATLPKALAGSGAAAVGQALVKPLGSGSLPDTFYLRFGFENIRQAFESIGRPKTL